MNLCDLGEYTSEKRIGEEESRRPRVAYGPPAPHCLKCSAAVDLSKHSGGVYIFDRRTETIHVCGPSLHQLMARNRYVVERMREKEAEEAARRTTLVVGGKRVAL